jgi:hypothetical protein
VDNKQLTLLIILVAVVFVMLCAVVGFFAVWF